MRKWGKWIQRSNYSLHLFRWIKDSTDTNCSGIEGFYLYISNEYIEFHEKFFFFVSVFCCLLKLQIRFFLYSIKSLDFQANFQSNFQFQNQRSFILPFSFEKWWWKQTTRDEMIVRINMCRFIFLCERPFVKWKRACEQTWVMQTNESHQSYVFGIILMR